MKQRENEKGIALIWLSLIIILVLAVAFTGIYVILMGDVNDNQQLTEYAQNNTEVKVDTKEKIKNNSWDIRIVSNITEEEVPVPNGYKYVSGTKKTGIIIEEETYRQKYLYIPYNEDVVYDTNEYYSKVGYNTEIDFMTLISIEKYGGFFVSLNNVDETQENEEKAPTIETLKTISKKEYENYLRTASFKIEGANSINVHLLYKEEIAQIESYIRSNNIELEGNTIGIQALLIEGFSLTNVSVTNERTTVDTSAVKNNNKATKVSYLKVANTNTSKSTDYVYLYELNNSKVYEGMKTVAIPKGFKYCETNEGIVLIQNKENADMVYVFVPYNKNAKNDLVSMYKNEISKYVRYNEDFYKIINNSTEKLDKDFEKSVNEYGGFYLSVAELSKDKSGRYMNVARGMVADSVTNTAYGGDYIRTSQYGLDEKIATEVKNSETTSSVESHIMYGVEYDSALTWIAKTNTDVTDKDGNDIYGILGYNSKNYGKYTDSGLKSTSSAKEVKPLNYLWYLGGNLAELTQEYYNKKSIIRGGSYATSGAEYPITSRTGIDKNTTVGDTVGVRTALYIKPGLRKTTEQLSSEFTFDVEDDTIIKIDGKYYQLLGGMKWNVSNWNGTELYLGDTPNTKAQTVHLEMAQEIEAYCIAKNSSLLENGEEIYWAKVKVTKSDNTKIEGWIKNIDTVVYKIKHADFKDDFIAINSGINGSFDKGIEVYTLSKDGANKTKDTKKSGGVCTIIEKSIQNNLVTCLQDDGSRFVASLSDIKFDGINKQSNITTNNGISNLLNTNEKININRTADVYPWWKKDIVLWYGIGSYSKYWWSAKWYYPYVQLSKKVGSVKVRVGCWNSGTRTYRYYDCDLWYDDGGSLQSNHLYANYGWNTGYYSYVAEIILYE